MHGRGPAHPGREGPGPGEYPGGGRHRVRAQPAGEGGLHGRGPGGRAVPEETHRPGARDPCGKDGRVPGHIPRPLVHRPPAARRGVGVEPETVEPSAPGDIRDRQLKERAPLARGRHKQKAGGPHHAGRPGGQEGRYDGSTPYTDDPARVAGCADCLELAAEDLDEDNEHWANCLQCQQEISARNGVEWRRVARAPCPHCGKAGW